MIGTVGRIWITVGRIIGGGMGVAVGIMMIRGIVGLIKGTVGRMRITFVGVGV